MAKVDKHFMTGSSGGMEYDFLDKDRNVNSNIAYMLNRSLSMFYYHNLPDTIPVKALELLLQTNGYGIFLEIEGEYYVVDGGLGGEVDVYGEPTKANISIPYLSYNKTIDVDEDCIVISNDTLRLGLLPIYNKYSSILNETEITMLLSLVNKRIQYLISASDDNTFESAKEYLKQVYDGNLGIIAENKLFDSLKINNSNTNTTSMRELIEFNQYIKATMYNEIGLQDNADMKRERMIQAEVITSNVNIYPLVDNMLEVRRLALEKINEKYGLDIEVEFSSSWEYRVNQGESINEPTIEDGVEPTIEDEVEPTIEDNIEPIIDVEVEPTIEDDVEEEIEDVEIEEVEEEPIEIIENEPVEDVPVEDEPIEEDEEEPKE